MIVDLYDKIVTIPAHTFDKSNEADANSTRRLISSFDNLINNADGHDLQLLDGANVAVQRWQTAPCDQLAPLADHGGMWL